MGYKSDRKRYDKKCVRYNIEYKDGKKYHTTKTLKEAKESAKRGRKKGLPNVKIKKIRTIC